MIVKLNKILRNWLWFFLLGAALVVIGVVILSTPGRSISIIMLFFSMMLIALGLKEFVAFVRCRKSLDKGWIQLCSSVIVVIMGFVLLGNTYASLFYLNTVVAVLMVMKSIQNIILFYALPQTTSNTGFFSWIYSLVLILMALFLWRRPEILSFILVTMSGVPIVILGFMIIGISLLIRDAKNKIIEVRKRGRNNTKDADYEILD